VPQQQFGQVRELVDAKVGSERGLFAFFAYYSDACDDEL
jgi:hypothetical protein